MKFTLNRDHVLSSTMGHAVMFKKNTPIYVPPPLYKEALALGAEPDETIPETEDVGNPNEPKDPADREAAIVAAFETVVLGNKREDFTAAGAPQLKVLSELLGWPIDAKERDRVWAKQRGLG